MYLTALGILFLSVLAVLGIICLIALIGWFSEAYPTAFFIVGILLALVGAYFAILNGLQN